MVDFPTISKRDGIKRRWALAINLPALGGAIGPIRTEPMRVAAGVRRTSSPPVQSVEPVQPVARPKPTVAEVASPRAAPVREASAFSKHKAPEPKPTPAPPRPVSRDPAPTPVSKLKLKRWARHLRACPSSLQCATPGVSVKGKPAFSPANTSGGESGWLRHP